ncbi:MAG: electron transfer flavoprotein subunit alpha/FixB family protein, partial [Myxococcota bacterium]|nr:electron transfer flavoprotein subunit alpha/FixB family protein [Myxococcota bacterium]
MGSGILVLCEHENGTFKRTAYELLGKASELAAELGGPVSALVLGHGDAGDLGSYGAQTVYTVQGEAFSRHNTGPFTRALQAAVQAAGPAVVLAPASPAAKDGLPRLAARLGLGLGTEVS